MIYAAQNTNKICYMILTKFEKYVYFLRNVSKKSTFRRK